MSKWYNVFQPIYQVDKDLNVTISHYEMLLRDENDSFPNSDFFRVVGTEEENQKWILVEKESIDQAFAKYPDICINLNIEPIQFAYPSVWEFIENIYAMMGWDRNCRYKVLGRIVTSNRGLIFVFELAEAIMFSPLPDEYFDKRTGQMKKRRIVYYPDEYKGRIGKSYHDYVLSQQMNMFEDLEGYVGDEAAVAK